MSAASTSSATRGSRRRETSRNLTESSLLTAPEADASGGFSVESAGPSTYPVSIRGVVYPSCRAAAEVLGLAENTVRQLVCRGRADRAGLGRRHSKDTSHSWHPFTVGPFVWPSKSAAAKALGYSVGYFRVLLREQRHDLILAAAMRLAVCGTPKVQDLSCSPKATARRTARLTEIAAIVAEEAGLDGAELRARSRQSRITHPRQEAMLRQRDAGFTLPQIAGFWGFDHTTVLHGCRAAAVRRRQDAEQEA